MAEVLRIVWRRKWIIAITVGVALVATYIGSRMIQPVYQATTKLRVSSAGGSLVYINPDTVYDERVMATYAEIGTSSLILDQLRDEMNLNTLPAIDVTVVANTQLVQIAVENHNPIMAADIANKLSDLLIEYSHTNNSESGTAAIEILANQLDEAKFELDQAQAEYDALVSRNGNDAEITKANSALTVRSQIYAQLLDRYNEAVATGAMRSTSLSVIEPASVPRVPIRPDINQNLLLGGVLGLLGGMGVAFFVDRADTTLHSVQRIESLIGLPILGQVPLARRSGLLGFLDADAKFLHPEAFRRLRSNLLNVMRKEGLRTILVASALPGEGKSTMVANLAMSLAEARRRVLVIDGDLHHPTMHLAFGLANTVGLTSVLKGETDFDQAIQQTVTPGVLVLTSGPPTPEPNALLSTVLMSYAIDQASYKYDVVLLDSPAFLAVADTTSLASIVSGVIIVASQGQAKEETVLSMRQELAKIGAHPIGVVANRVSHDFVSQYSRHYLAVSSEDAEAAENVVISGSNTVQPETEVRPAPIVERQPPPSAKPRPILTEKRKVLIIEDNEDILLLMDKSLTLHDYEVKTTVDGEVGIQLAKEWEPDVVLVDVMMPQISGIEVCRELKSNKQTAGIPIIIVTARSTIEDKREGFYAGADDYLVKPFKMAELALRIEALLRRSSTNYRAELDHHGI